MTREVREDLKLKKKKEGYDRKWSPYL